MKHPGGGKRDADDIVGGGEEKILANDANGPPAAADGVGSGAQVADFAGRDLARQWIAAHESEGGAGFRHGGGVVETIAHKKNGALALEGADALRFVEGGKAGFGAGKFRGRAVAGQHGATDAGGFEFRDDAPRGLAQALTQPGDADEDAVADEINFVRRADGEEPGTKSVGGDRPGGIEKRGVADAKESFSDAALDANSRNGADVARGGGGNEPPEGTGHRMQTGKFHGGGLGEQALAVDARRIDKVDELQVFLGKRSRLVEDDLPDCGQPLHEVARGRDDAAPREVGKRGPHADGRGEAHRTRAGDKDDRQGVEHADHPAGVRSPPAKCDGGDGQDEGKKPRDETIGFAFETGGTRLSGAHAREHRIEKAACSGNGGPHLQRTVHEPAAGEDGIARAPRDRKRLSGKGGFVDERRTSLDDTVDGDRGAGGNVHAVADADFADRDDADRPIVRKAFARLELRAEGAGGIQGGTAAALAEKAPKGVDGEKDRDHFVINVADARDRGNQRSPERAENSREKKLLEGNARPERGADERRPDEDKDHDRRKRERRVENEPRGAGRRTQIDGQREDHRLCRDGPGESQAQPPDGGGTIFGGRFNCGRRALAAGRHESPIVGCPGGFATDSHPRPFAARGGPEADFSRFRGEGDAVSFEPMRRVWIALGIFVVLLAGVVVGLNLWIHSYLRSDDFRRLVAAKTGQALRADVDYQPLDWSGSSVFSAAMTARGESGVALENLEAGQVRANIDWRAIFDGAWRVDRLDIVRLDAKLRTAAQKAESAGEPGPKPDAAPPRKGWLPNRFQLDRVSVQDANAEIGAIGRLRNVTLTVQPEGDGWVFDGRGGKLELPPRELGIDSFRVRLHQNVVYLTDAALRLGGNGAISASGELGGVDGPFVAHLEWRDVSAADVLEGEWKSRLTGTISGRADTRGRVNQPPITMGKFFLADGTLEGIPVQRQIAKFTRSPQFERMPLREVSGDFATDGVTTTVRNFVLESPGLLRVEGRVRLGANGKLDGHFRVGVTSQSLQWLPGSQEKIFTVSENGYLWTNVKIGGTVGKPSEDLSDRLARAVGEQVIDTGVELLRQAPDHATDAVDKAIEILSPLIP